MGNVPSLFDQVWPSTATVLDTTGTIITQKALSSMKKKREWFWTLSGRARIIRLALCGLRGIGGEPATRPTGISLGLSRWGTRKEIFLSLKKINGQSSHPA